MMNNNPILQMLMNGGNPQQIIQNLMQNNPQARAMYQQMQNSGMQPKDFVLQYAKQNNIDIQPYINMMNQKGYKL